MRNCERQDMEFTLFIKDKVKSNGTPTEKHRIRTIFHEQLNELLNLSSLKKNEIWKKTKNNKLYKPRLKKSFIALVTKNLDTYAELNINFYVPSNTSFKDIDNKLKTICDALSLPGLDKGTKKIINAWK